MKRWLVRNGTALVLDVFAVLARTRGALSVPSRKIIDGVGSTVARARGLRPGARTPAELGAVWQDAFASKKHVPIVEVDSTTAYAEIRTPCPLRGSGDVEACHRMMGYDRAFLAAAGGELVVLRSQAEPGVTTCLVAIRASEHGTEGLEAAHERVRRPQRNDAE